MTTRLIGDVHGKFNKYFSLIKKAESSIQVGDFGLGFLDIIDKQVIDLLKNEHKFIRGNHDNPAVCKTSTSFIEDGTIINDVMFIGGGFSIDRNWRTENVNWWADEELSYEELYNLIEVYSIARPRVVISHDCPKSVSYQAFVSTGLSLTKATFKNRTNEALQAMFDIHQPDLWIFGHWHSNYDEYIKSTRFICLSELQYIDVDFDTLEIKKPKSFDFKGL